MEKVSFHDIDEYIAEQSKDSRSNLELLRKTIQKTAPEAIEVISYNMPAFKLKGKILVWFAVATNHYGLYPYAKTIEVFKDKLKGYELSKGTIRFPKDKPLPIRLIADIIKFRMDEIPSKIKPKPSMKKKV